MKLACRTKVFGASGLEEILKKVSRIGFRAVELDIDHLRRQFCDRQDWPKAVFQLLESYEMKPAGVAVGAITAERTDQLKLQVSTIRRNIEVAKGIGAELAIITGGDRTLENYNCIVSGLHELSDSAGLTVVVSNQINSRIENRTDLIALFQPAFPGQIGLCIDVMHFHQAAINAGDAIREMGPRIKLFRIADMMGLTPVLLGQGEIEIKALLRGLRMAKYDGYVVIDNVPPHQKIEKSLKHDYEYMMSVIS